MDADGIMQYADMRFMAWLGSYRQFLLDHVQALDTLINNYHNLLPATQKRGETDATLKSEGFVPAPDLITCMAEAKRVVEAVHFGLLQHCKKETNIHWYSRLWHRRGWVPGDEFVTQVNEAKQLIELVTNELLLHQKQVLSGQEIQDNFKLFLAKQKHDDPATQ